MIDFSMIKIVLKYIKVAKIYRETMRYNYIMTSIPIFNLNIRP